MFQDTTFHKTMGIVSKLLNTYAVRSEVLADNIANVSTPNFKRSEVTFEHQLNRALASQHPQGIQAKTTSQKHIPFDIPLDPDAVQPNIVLDYDTSYRNDKNNVDIDREMSEHAKNTMNYQMFSQIMGNQYRQLRRMIGVM